MINLADVHVALLADTITVELVVALQEVLAQLLVHARIDLCLVHNGGASTAAIMDVT